MDSATILAVVVGATLVLQTLAFTGLLRAVRVLTLRLENISTNLQKDSAGLVEKAGSLMSTIQTTAEKLQELQDHVTATMAVVHHRTVELDAFVAETTDAARLQIIRIQQTLDTASRKIEDTVDLVHNGVLAPISEVHALARGLRVGINYFARARRSRQSGNAAFDDEMFI
jgi:hypothetical protein